MPYVIDGGYAPPNPQLGSPDPWQPDSIQSSGTEGQGPPDPWDPRNRPVGDPRGTDPYGEAAAAATEDPFDDEEAARRRAEKEWQDWWDSLDPAVRDAIAKDMAAHEREGEGDYDPAIAGAAQLTPDPLDEQSGFEDYPFEDKIKQYIETKDPALRAEIENAVWWLTVWYASQGDRESYDEMNKWWEEMKHLMDDIDAGKYDPEPEPEQEDFTEFFDDDPHRGRPRDSGPSPAAKAYQDAAKYYHDTATFGASGTSLHRRIRRSQTDRQFRIRKWKYIDPYPWIPGTVPEKTVFEQLVRRGIYFIFQGQAPELEEGAYSTMAVPGFEPDFVLPQYKIIIDPFSPFHHSLAGAVKKDEQKIMLYESLGYRYYHPWAMAPNEWSFDQVGVNHGRFSTEDMLNQMPELGRPPKPLSARELPFIGQGYRLGKNLGAGANSVAAANRARARSALLVLTRGVGRGRVGSSVPIPKRPLRRTV